MTLFLLRTVNGCHTQATPVVTTQSQTLPLEARSVLLQLTLSEQIVRFPIFKLLVEKFCIYICRGNDYEAHIKCVTEEERYSGKGFTAKEKKGEKKQTAWVDMIQSVLDEQKNTSSNVIRIIETISKHNNTPRKKPKFVNFVKNVCGNKTNIKDIDQAWDIISVKLTALANLNAQNNNKKKEDKTDDDSVSEEKRNGHALNGLENGNVENGEETNGEVQENGKENGVDKQDDLVSYCYKPTFSGFGLCVKPGQVHSIQQVRSYKEQVGTQENPMDGLPKVVSCMQFCL